MAKIRFFNIDAIFNNFSGQEAANFVNWLNSTERAAHVIRDTMPEAHRWISDADVSNFKNEKDGH